MRSASQGCRDKMAAARAAGATRLTVTGARLHVLAPLEAKAVDAIQRA
jgi:hypothetical protein